MNYKVLLVLCLLAASAISSPVPEAQDAIAADSEGVAAPVDAQEPVSDDGEPEGELSVLPEVEEEAPLSVLPEVEEEAPIAVLPEEPVVVVDAGTQTEDIVADDQVSEVSSESESESESHSHESHSHSHSHENKCKKGKDHEEYMKKKEEVMKMMVHMYQLVKDIHHNMVPMADSAANVVPEHAEPEMEPVNNDLDAPGQEGPADELDEGFNNPNVPSVSAEAVADEEPSVEVVEEVAETGAVDEASISAEEEASSEEEAEDEASPVAPEEGSEEAASDDAEEQTPEQQEEEQEPAQENESETEAEGETGAESESEAEGEIGAESESEAESEVVAEIELPASAPECGEHQAWTDCGSSCPRTCNFDETQPCTMQCVQECQCVDGYVLHEGACILEAECPAPVPECPENEEFTDCGTACPKTCGPDAELCTLQCVVGCVCSEGLVRHDGKCIVPEECPADEAPADEE